MIGTFKKIWEFSGEERGNINKSVAVSFLNAVFHMFEIGAIYFVVMALTNGDKELRQKMPRCRKQQKRKKQWKKNHRRQSGQRLRLPHR